jgi:hypothetical protein
MSVEFYRDFMEFYGSFVVFYNASVEFYQTVYKRSIPFSAQDTLCKALSQ